MFHRRKVSQEEKLKRGAKMSDLIGITLNDCSFQGVVDGDPQILNTPEGGQVAFISLRTTATEMAQNGQWVESTVNVPLIVSDLRKVDVVKKYVKDKRQLYVRAYYKEWMSEQGKEHGMVVTLIKLGTKRKPNEGAFIPE
jgi:single-stranded DNA-binding protein